MENDNSALLPHILESLNRKPECCDTYENLRNEIKIIFSDDKLGNKMCKALDKAIDVGQSLGVIQMTDDLVRIPFNFNRGTACPRAICMESEHKIEGEAAPVDAGENVIMQPRRTHSVKPNVISPIRLRRRRRRSIGGRKRRRRARRRR